VTDRIAPRSAARRLASELKLPSWKGTVVSLLRGDKYVLVVAAEKRWARQARVPSTYCGYKVEIDDPLEAVAQRAQRHVHA